MKKVILILIGLISIAIASLYIFIPGKIILSRSITIQANQNALLRKFINNESWKKWWPGKQQDDTTYVLNGIKFKPTPIRILSLPVAIDAQNFEAVALLNFITLGKDSTTLQIETSIPVSYNPFTRINAYNKSKKIEACFSEILQAANTTYSRTVALYDYDIQKKSVVDSILVFISEKVKGYPSIAKIYSLVDELKDYIHKSSANETGFPMLNINKADSIDYFVKVAIPVDKRLPDAGKIKYKWMLGGGNILVTEIKGGPGEIINAYKQIRNFVSDYNRISPAIPFESLVTDRRNEPDTGKWITRIYYPVI